MNYYFTQEDLDALSAIAERIQRLVGKAIGREEAVQARRDQFKIIDFTAELAKKKRNQNFYLLRETHF